MELMKKDDEVRRCYSEEFSKLDAKDMALIMLLDGCFIIYLMLKRIEFLQKRNMEMGIEEKTEEEEKDEVENLEDEKTEDEGNKRRECSMIEIREEEVFLNIQKEKTEKEQNGEGDNELLEKRKMEKGIEKKAEEEEKDKVENLEDEKIEDEDDKRRECTCEIGEEEVVLNIQKEEEQLEGPTMAGLSTFYLVVFDLLKLENQIPFFIVKLLFDKLKTREDESKDLVDLALQAFQDIHPFQSKTFVKRPASEYHHLLHLFYSSRIPGSAQAPLPTAIKHRDLDYSAPRWSPNATELDRAGVKFKTKEPADSFLNITFESRRKMIFPLLRSGRMEIPPMQIYDYTGPLFRNLIAFEQCYPETEMHITIYALFMDCIIDQAEDVRLLHLRGILEHKLNNDQAVADLFNQLGSQIHFFGITEYHTDQIVQVALRVKDFCLFKRQKWIAMLRRDYLYSPWAIISVFAAIILLLLTIEQAVFAGLSYFHYNGSGKR